MESQNGFKQFARAVFHELFRSKTGYNILAFVILVAVAVAGYYWQERYVSSATVAVELNSDSAELSEEERLVEMTPAELADYQAVIDVNKERLLALVASLDFRQEIYQRFAERNLAIVENVVNEKNFFRDLTVRVQPQSKYIHFAYQAKTAQMARGNLQFILEELLNRVKPTKKLEKISDQVEDFKENEAKLSASIADLKAEIESLQAGLDGADAQMRRERIRSIRVSMEDAQVGINASNARIDSIKTQLETERELYQQRQRLSQLQNQQSKLLSSLEEAEQSYEPGAPQIISLQQELDNVRVQLNELRGNPLVFADTSEQPLHEQLRQKLSLQEVEKRAIESRYESLRTLLNDESVRISKNRSQAGEIEQREQALAALIQRYEGIQIQKQARLTRQQRIKTNQPVYELVNDATRPDSYKGLGFIEFLIAGPLLAVCVPVFLASFIVLLDAKIRSGGRLRRAVGSAIPVMAVIPHYSSPKTARVFRKAILGLVVWGVVVVGAYAALGVIGLKT